MLKVKDLPNEVEMYESNFDIEAEGIDPLKYPIIFILNEPFTIWGIKEEDIIEDNVGFTYDPDTNVELLIGEE